MKKYPFCHWLLVGTMTILSNCQSRDITPETPSQNRMPCREDECDEQEAGEEAHIELLNIQEPEKEESAAVQDGSKEKNVSTINDSSAVEQQEQAQETTDATPTKQVESAEVLQDQVLFMEESTNMSENSSKEHEMKAQENPSVESAEVLLDQSLLLEDDMSESSSNGPVSESPVTLSCL